MKIVLFIGLKFFHNVNVAWVLVPPAQSAGRSPHAPPITIPLSSLSPAHARHTPPIRTPPPRLAPSQQSACHGPFKPRVHNTRCAPAPPSSPNARPPRHRSGCRTLAQLACPPGANHASSQSRLPVPRMTIPAKERQQKSLARSASIAVTQRP